MKPTHIHPAVTVCDHPLLQHNLAVVRDKHSSREIFRASIHRVAQFVLQEATRFLPMSATTVETPVASAQASILTPDVPIIVTPILRAGLIMGDVMIDLIPTANIYHIGLYRDENTLNPVTYYNKLPAQINYKQAKIFILDPMLATGGSISAALDIMLKLGAVESNITVACIIAVPEGIKALTDKYKNIKIITASVDEKLNEHAFIVPGLGDAGDRAFGT